VDKALLERYIVDVPDFPSPGILFRDITPLLGHGPALDAAVDAVSAVVADLGASKVVGIEARGFVVGTPVAHQLGLGFVPVRKAGKLPREVISVTYDLEYGTDTLAMHADAVLPDERVVIVDDVLATGGTASAAAQLVESTGAQVVGLAFLIELAFLAGRSRLGERRVESVLTY
jgi:adenine phosphoribosyltransferase